MSNYNTGAYFAPYNYNIGTNLQGMSAAPYDLYIDQGDTYLKEITIRDNNGGPVNISGMTVTATMKRYYGDSSSFLFDVDVTQASTGNVTLKMSTINTSKLKNPRYVYEVKLSDTYSTTKFMYGQVLVTPMV